MPPLLRGFKNIELDGFAFICLKTLDRPVSWFTRYLKTWSGSVSNFKWKEDSEKKKVRVSAFFGSAPGGEHARADDFSKIMI